MTRLRVIRLPDCFYLPRFSRLGLEMRDVMPWRLAITYVTDGERVGVEFHDGTVEWLLRPRGTALDTREFELRRDVLPASLVVRAEPYEIMQEIWRENADAFAARHSVEPAAA